jgi:5-methyltetrahydropteroyltriglutamate--homocysteine methyltransferase
MKISTDRILTTHVGSLPRPNTLVELLRAKDALEDYDRDRFAREVRQSVTAVVRKQAGLGIDVVDDGEHSKAGFSSYVRARLGGLEPAPDGAMRPPNVSKDSLAFPGAYDDLKQMYDARTRWLGRPRAPNTMPLVCTGPITYIGHADVRADIENLKLALQPSPAAEGFITALSPTNIEGYFANEYYKSQQEYLFAIADAMHEEYKAVTDAGFIVQIDDPRLITHYDRTPGITVEENRKFIAQHIEAVNHALRRIPPEKVRFHTCYSTNMAPRTHDLELKDFVDQMLTINAAGYSIEAANPRHEHEWRVWEDIKLPDGKVLIPGVISHCSYLVEHPELVAQRIARFAGVVGRERVIASNDCGFATSAAGDDIPPDIAWAKLEALVAGARLATRQLWGRS